MKKLTLIEGMFSRWEGVMSSWAPVTGGHRTQGAIKLAQTVTMWYDLFQLDNLSEYAEKFGVPITFLMYCVKVKHRAEISLDSLIPAHALTAGKMLFTKLGHTKTLYQMGQDDNLKSNDRRIYSPMQNANTVAGDWRKHGKIVVGTRNSAPPPLDDTDLLSFKPVLLNFDSFGVQLSLYYDGPNDTSCVRTLLRTLEAYRQWVQVARADPTDDNASAHEERLRSALLAMHQARMWHLLDEELLKVKPGQIFLANKRTRRKPYKQSVDEIIKELHEEYLVGSHFVSLLKPNSMGVKEWRQYSLEAQSNFALAVLRKMREQHDVELAEHHLSAGSYTYCMAKNALKADATPKVICTFMDALQKPLCKAVRKLILRELRHTDGVRESVLKHSSCVWDANGDERAINPSGSTTGVATNFILKFCVTLGRRDLLSTHIPHRAPHEKLDPERPEKTVKGLCEDLRNGCMPSCYETDLQSQPYNRASLVGDMFQLQETQRTQNAMYCPGFLPPMLSLIGTTASPLAEEMCVRMCVCCCACVCSRVCTVLTLLTGSGLSRKNTMPCREEKWALFVSSVFMPWRSACCAIQTSRSFSARTEF